nr:hypothetical protein [Providencia stuartii]
MVRSKMILLASVTIWLSQGRHFGFVRNSVFQSANVVAILTVATLVASKTAYFTLVD